jgi:hypothetical protein
MWGDITEKVREARLILYRHVIRSDEEELFRNTMEERDRKKMWDRRHYREGEGNMNMLLEEMEEIG